ncbi:DinB family protein [Dehalococcoidia bacterium]|nr:DinB family protein [Dehalococcoidia bacterium]
MAEPVAVTPTYASGDLAHILEIEQRQIEDTVADLSEEQMVWLPNPKAKSALDIIWHLAYPQLQHPKPSSKTEALKGLRTAYDRLQKEIATPGKLDEPVTWWTGGEIPYRGVVWGAIRHCSYHLGELVYLRQAMGLDEPKYYHEE